MPRLVPRILNLRNCDEQRATVTRATRVKWRQLAAEMLIGSSTVRGMPVAAIAQEWAGTARLAPGSRSISLR